MNPSSDYLLKRTKPIILIFLSCRDGFRGKFHTYVIRQCVMSCLLSERMRKDDDGKWSIILILYDFL